MKYEIIETKELRVIGIAKELKMSEGHIECPKFWDEFVKRYKLKMLKARVKLMAKRMLGKA